MLDIVRIFTILLSLYFLFDSIKRVVLSYKYIYSLFYIIFFISFCLPVFFDFFADYTYKTYFYPLIDKAHNDEVTNYIYIFFINYFSIVFKYLEKKNLPKKNIYINTILKKSWIMNTINIIIFIGIILVLFNPESEKFLIYGHSALRNFSENNLQLTLFTYSLINLSVVLIFYKILVKNKGFINALIYIPFFIFFAYINGKRNMVILILFFLFYVLISDKKIRTISKVFLSSFSAILFYLYFNYYNQYVKVLDSSIVERSPFFRDNTLKLVSFLELHPEVYNFFDYNFQSILFYFTFYIPREVWLDKPMPYAQYITNAALNIEEKDFLGWGLTNSIFDELISNFGLWIILLFPFMFNYLFKKTIVFNDKFTIVFTFLVATLLIMVEVTAYIPLYIIYIIYIIYLKSNKKKQYFR